MRKEFQIILVIAMSLSISCNTRNTKKNEAAANQLAGTWRLLEYTDFDTVTGKPKYPYGEHPNGYFTYTKNGIVNINGSAEKPLIVAPADEYKTQFTLGALLDKAFGYFGTYTIDTINSVVTHHVTGGSVLTYIGTDQHRQFVLKGDTLLLGDPQFKKGKRVLVREE